MQKPHRGLAAGPRRRATAGPASAPRQIKKSPTPFVHAASRVVSRQFWEAYAWLVASYRDEREALRDLLGASGQGPGSLEGFEHSSIVSRRLHQLVAGAFAFSTRDLPLAAPFRRVMDADWFVPIARIGRSGPDFPLTASPAQFTAPASGELFLFVNDAILPPWLFFYGNNLGNCDSDRRRGRGEANSHESGWQRHRSPIARPEAREPRWE
jgi:hypothetical protein